MAPPLRVLHVNAGNLFGGVETFLVTLARCHDLCPDMVPEYAVCFPGRFRDELTAAGVPVHDLGPVRASRPWTAARGRRALRRLLSAGRYDVAVCHQPWAQAVFGRVVERSGVGHVAYYHGPTGGGWEEWLARRRRPRLVVAPSRHSLDTVRRLFPSVPGKVLNYPIPPGVAAAPELSPGRRAEVRRAFGAGPDEAVILQANRVERWKGPDVVLRALGRLRDVPGWRFWFAGGPQRPSEQTYYDELRSIAAEEGIADRVAFLGGRSDVPELMRAADVYCQGNRGPEGFSLAFLEASYSGLPVVTTDIGGAAEMVDPQTGALVPAGDVPALADALAGLIRDPARRRAAGAAARAKAAALCDPGGQIRRLHKYLAAAAGRDG